MVRELKDADFDNNGIKQIQQIISTLGVNHVKNHEHVKFHGDQEVLSQIANYKHR